MFLELALNALIVMAHAEDKFAAPGVSGASATAKPRHDDCAELLSRTREGWIRSLKEKLESYRKHESCALAAPPEGACEAMQKDDLEDLGVYSQWRQKAFEADISYNPLDKDFVNAANSSSNSSSALGHSLNSLSGASQHSAWNEFESSEKNFINEWWSHQDKSKYPNWQSCLTQDQSGLQFTRRNSHLFVPSFSANIPRANAKECGDLQAYFAGAPYALPMVKSIRLGGGEEPGLHAEKRELEGKFKPWMYMVTEDPSSLDDKGKKALVAHGYNRVGEETKKMLQWLEKLEPADEYKLLSFDAVSEDLDGNEICRGKTKKSWASIAGEIGLSLIPGYDFYEGVFIKRPLNDRAFLSGFVSRDGWEEQNESITRDEASSLLTAPLSAATGQVALEKLAAKAGPVVGKVFSGFRKSTAATSAADSEFNISSITNFYRDSGFKSSPETSAKLTQQFSELALQKTADGQIAWNGPEKLTGVVGKGWNAVVARGESGDVYKIPVRAEKMSSMSVEIKVNKDLKNNYGRYKILVDDIVDHDANGAWIRKKYLNPEGMAEHMQSLSAEQSRKLEQLFNNAKRYSSERGIGLDLKASNLWWNGKDWVLFDSGPRMAFRPYGFTKDVDSFSDYMKIWREFDPPAPVGHPSLTLEQVQSQLRN